MHLIVMASASGIGGIARRSTRASSCGIAISQHHNNIINVDNHQK